MILSIENKSTELKLITNYLHEILSTVRVLRYFSWCTLKSICSIMDRLILFNPITIGLDVYLFSYTLYSTFADLVAWTM